MALVFQVDAANPASYPGSGSVWYDVSGNGQNVTLINSPTFTNTNGVTSINFNGTTQRGEFTPSSLVYGSAPRTLAAWVRMNGWRNNGVGVAFMYGTQAYGQSYGVWVGINVYYAAADSNDVAYYAPSNLNQFYHLVNVYDGITAKLYLNGNLVASDARSWNTVQQSTAYLAAYVNSGYLAECSLGKASVWNTAFSDAEVLAEYQVDADRYNTLAYGPNAIDTAALQTAWNMCSPDMLAETRVLSGGAECPQPTPVVANHAELPTVL